MRTVARDGARIRDKRLVETDAESQLRRAHAEHFLRRAQSAQLSTEAGGEQRFEAVLLEQDNLRAAFDWALENDPLLAAGLAISLEQFWVSTRPFEGMRWFEALHGTAPSCHLSCARERCSLTAG